MHNIMLDESFNVLDYKLYKVDEINSTNTYFKENYFKYPNHSILLAKRQTNGRGRYNRCWESKDDITMSFLFKSKQSDAIIAPLAVALSLNELKIPALIKWPNDILVMGKKLSGILIEDVFEPNFKASIVGIGINMNRNISYESCGVLEYKDISKIELIKSIVKKYDYLINLDFDTVIELYKSLSFILGKRIMYKNKEYIAEDITDKGLLVIKGSEGSITICSDEINIKESII